MEKCIKTSTGDGKKNFSQRRKGTEDAELLFDIFDVTQIFLLFIRLRIWQLTVLHLQQLSFLSLGFILHNNLKHKFLYSGQKTLLYSDGFTVSSNLLICSYNSNVVFPATFEKVL